MKSPRLPLRDALERFTREALEQLAADLFDPNRVKKKLSERAATGYRSLTIGPEQPFDLRHTAQAKRLEAFLKSERLAFRWRSRTGLSEGEEDIHLDLVISWLTPDL
jgi:hypothetical protein